MITIAWTMAAVAVALSIGRLGVVALRQHPVPFAHDLAFIFAVTPLGAGAAAMIVGSEHGPGSGVAAGLTLTYAILAFTGATIHRHHRERG